MELIIGDPDCKACELYETAQAVCLMGKGPIPSKVMLIGEAPGFREDEIGKPFAGKAGQLLDKVLSGVGLKRDSLYITNICKCRPPDNRTPKASEIKACKPFLDIEINRVEPQFVILLGAVPTKAFLKKKITESHGQIYEEDGIFYMPTFHPAAALRDPKRLDPIHADFERFAKVIKTGKREEAPKLNLTVINTFEQFNDLIMDIKGSREVAFDLETTSLDWFREEETINCMGLATPNAQWVLPLNVKGSKFGSYDLQKEMVEIIGQAMKDKKVITQNGKFDNTYLRSRYGVRYPITFDTLLASALLDENSPNSLSYLSSAYFKAPDYDIPLKDKTHPDTKKKVQDMFTYCGYDVYYTLQLYYLFKEKLKEDPRLLKVFKYLSMPLVEIYEDIEEEGITIDTKKLDEVEEDLIRMIKEKEKELKEFTKGKEVNWNSPQQVANVLFHDWKLNPIKKTPSGAESTDESVLKMLAKRHRGVQVLLDYRGLHKLYSGFVNSWKERMVDGKLHPSYKISGTVTGRPSAENPNLQQTPRESKIRSLIHAPPGWELVELDQSQIELRVAAMLSGDRTMKFIFQTKGDIHTSTAQDVASKEVVTKDERKKAKAVNFGFIYGMGWKKFMEYSRDKYGIELTPSQARSYRKRYFEKYYDLPRWHERQRNKARMYQEVRTLTGRLRRLPSVLSTDEGIRAEAERQSINCVDELTECLSMGGWKRYNQLKVGEKILTKNPKSNLLEWNTIEHLNIGKYSGTMYEFQSKSFSALTTPEHRWLITTGSHDRWKDGRVPNHIMTSEELYNRNRGVRIHRTGEYLGANSSPWSDDEVELIGWIITEGCYKKSGGLYDDGRRRSKTSYITICQSQRANPEKVEMIRSLLNRMGFQGWGGRTKWGSTVYWRIYGDTSNKIRAALPDKDLTMEFLMGLTKRQLEILYQTMLLGDGSTKGKKLAYSQKKKESAELFQILAILNEKATNIYLRDQTNIIHKSDKLPNKQIQGIKSWKINIHKRKYATTQGPRSGKTIKPIKVNNKVIWCPTVKNGTFVARRRGQTYITGQSPVQGFAAEVTLMGLIAIWEYFDPDILKPVGTVHDAVLMLIRRDKLDEVLPKAKKLMENPPLLRKFEINLTVPLIAEAKVGPWGTGKEYEFSP